MLIGLIKLIRNELFDSWTRCVCVWGGGKLEEAGTRKATQKKKREKERQKKERKRKKREYFFGFNFISIGEIKNSKNCVSYFFQISSFFRIFFFRSVSWHLKTVFLCQIFPFYLSLLFVIFFIFFFTVSLPCLLTSFLFFILLSFHFSYFL